MKKLFLSLLTFLISIWSFGINLSGTYTVGSGGGEDYINLTVVAAALNNAGNTVTGNVIFELTVNYNGAAGETFPIVFNQYLTSGAWTVTIRPQTGVTARITSGDPGSAFPLIDFNGVDNLIFDGRSGGTGAANNWTIQNMRTAATVGPAIRLTGGANNNLLQYLNIKSSNSQASSGTLFLFCNSTGPGNSFDLIQNCDIGQNGTNYPANAICAYGYSNTYPNSNIQVLNNNIHDFFSGGTTSGCGVLVTGTNLNTNWGDNWTITGNSFYRTVNNSLVDYMIKAIDFSPSPTTSGTSMGNTISNNSIGGNAPVTGGSAVSGVWVTAAAPSNQPAFQGITVNAKAAIVSGNVIGGIFDLNISGQSGFTGIYLPTGNTAGSYTISNNTIGSTYGPGNIYFSSSTTSVLIGMGSKTFTVPAGLSYQVGDRVRIGTQAAQGGSYCYYMEGVVTSYVGTTLTINIDILLGSGTFASWYITLANGVQSSGQWMMEGIWVNIGGGICSITGNTVGNLTNTNAVNSVDVACGIIAQNGGYNISGNTVYNLAASCATTSAILYVAARGSVVGIANQSVYSNLVQTANNNTVYNLYSTLSSATATRIMGIDLNGTGGGYTHIADGNLVYNLICPNTNTLAQLTGISLPYNAGGTGTYILSNNMIRLGLRNDGSSITGSAAITGILDESPGSSTVTIKTYHNSVYIGGSGVASGAINTYAFRRNNTNISPKNIQDIRNNIFVNNRSNASGTGKNCSLGFDNNNNLGTSTDDYNVYYGTGTGYILAQVAGVDQPTFAALRTAASNANFDINSQQGDPAFMSPTTGIPNLHINPAALTPIDGTGTAAATLTYDFDGEARALLTPVDIGADAGNFLTPPLITYTALTNTSNCTTSSLVVNITAVSGVNTSSGTAPRLYYKRLTDNNAWGDNSQGTNGWKWVECTSPSGNSFTFNMDYSLTYNSIADPVAAGDFIQYFVVAQNNNITPVVGINSGTPATSPLGSVADYANLFALTGTINQYWILPSQGTYTLGTGGQPVYNYATLTGAWGFFAGMNDPNTLISGNITFNISTDATEDGTNGLNQWTENPVGSNYTITIQSSAAILRTLSGNYTGAAAATNGLIRFNGADRVTVNGGSGLNRYLLFSNSSLGVWASTFCFISDAKNNNIINTIVEGCNQSGNNGVIALLTSGGTTLSGNDFISIRNCIVRNGTTYPMAGIYSAGTAGQENDNNTIENNVISGFVNNEILISNTGNGGNWQINRNHLFCPAIFTSAHNSIYFLAGAASSGNSICGNIIGGNAADHSGLWTNTGAGSSYGAINVNAGVGVATIVDSNVILNMNFSGVTSSFSGISAGMGSFLIGSAPDKGNIIGGNITFAGNSNNYGINCTGPGANLIGYNIIRGLNFTSAGTSNAFIGIRTSQGTNTVSDNIISNIQSASNNTAVDGFSGLCGISFVNLTGTNQICRSNTIYDLRNTAAGAINTKVTGINFWVISASGNYVEKNLIHSLKSVTTSTTASIKGIILQGSNTVVNSIIVANNMIRLGIDAGGASQTNAVPIIGIEKTSTTPMALYHNSIYIGGTGVVAGAVNTMAFSRTANPAANPDDFRDNIFVNNRSNAAGTGKHYAISLNNATILTCNYNVFYVNGTGTVFGVSNAIDYADLCTWQAQAGNPDLNSIQADPIYINPTGTSATIDLHINTGLATPIEATGIAIAGITDDFDSQTRASYSPTDIGADAGNFIVGYVAPGPMSGSYNIPGDFLTLTGPCGFFAAVNARGLSGNVVANITADITEPGDNPLNQWAEFPAASNFTITIQSSAAIQRVLTSNYNGAGISTNGTIRLNGADRVTITGGTGAQRFLLFRNTNTGAQAAVLQLLNDAQNNLINNCIFEGSSISPSNGDIYFGIAATIGTPAGNDNNTITLCDIKEAGVNYPANGIYALGTNTAGQENSGNTISNSNIYNFFISTTTSCGILFGGNTMSNIGWTIDGNSFYQTVARNFTAVNGEFRVISIEHTAGTDYTIINNYIGGSAPLCGGGAWTQTGNAGIATNFLGIRLSLSSNAPGASIQGNTITNINYSTQGVSTANAGMNITQGRVNIGTITKNIIGSSTATGAILVQTGGGEFKGIMAGTGGATVLNIRNNEIGGISVNGASTTLFRGIQVSNTAPTSMVISNNLIGSTTIANSITNSTSATTTAGIYCTVGSATTNDITNNIIDNITINTTNATPQLLGIYTAGGKVNISGNTIRNLTSQALNVTGGAGTCIIGILNASTVAGQAISNNTIHSLVTTSTANNVGIFGIYNAMGAAAAPNLISQNFIHSFLSSNTSGVPNQCGIYNFSGNASILNNMIQLGRKPDGSQLTQTNQIIGIEDASTTANAIQFNSVFLDANVAGVTATNTFAFRRSAASGADDIRNNIFANNIIGGPAGSRHYSLALNTITGIATFDYNIYQTNTGGNLFSITNGAGSLASPQLQALRASTAAGTGQNLHSGVGTLALINFINPLGNAATVNLHLNNATCASDAGITIAGITTDIDNDIRNNPPDIGADEAGFDPLNASTDIYTPNFTYTAIPTQAPCGGILNFTATATITDLGTGVPVAGPNVPVMWYRQSLPVTTAWSYVTGVLQSGNGNNGVWQFTLNINPAGYNETYQYYFVAEDLSSPVNRWFSHFDATTPVHPAVTLQTTPTAVPASFTTVSLVPLSGTVTVGATGGATYLSFTKAAGLFNDIFNRGLSGNLTVLVRSDVLTEDGTWALYPWTEYCGAGYRIIVQPETQSLKTLSGSLIGMGLFQIQGADNVTFEGAYAGAGRYLKFANTYSGNGGSENNTFNFMDNSTLDTIRNCIITGATTKDAWGGGGVVAFHGSTGAGDGNSHNVIDNNLISGDANWAVRIIYSVGGGGTPNHANSIINNEIFNFLKWSGGASTSYGIQIDNGGNGGDWNISNNSIYCTGINGQSVMTGISFIPGAASTGNIISGNYIGGDLPLCGVGAIGYWGNSTAGLSKGIVLNCGSVNLSGNTMRNIRCTEGDAGAFICVDISGATQANITGNTFGSSDINLRVQAMGGGISLGSNPGYVFGIRSMSSASVTIDNNSFTNLVANGGCGTCMGSYVKVIEHTGQGTAIITNNTISNCQGAGYNYDSYGISLKPSISSSGNIIRRNTINTPLILGSAAGITSLGIYFYGAANNHSGLIQKNRIYDTRNSSPNGFTEGIWLDGWGTQTWQVSNNQISLSNSAGVTSVALYGIEDDLSYAFSKANSRTTVLHNSVYISGTRTGANNSFGFFRYPGGSGTVAGDEIYVKDNIFINQASGGTGKHYAIANYGTSNFATYWNAGASDYNFLASASLATLGVWGTTDRNFAQWQTTANGDANSTNAQTTGGASTGTLINPNNLFNNPSIGDLNLITTDGVSYLFVHNNGTALLADDYNNDTRQNPPEIGADEIELNPLPVELLKFTAIADNDHVDLDWSTATELNNDYFTIERSKEAVEFEEIINIPGSGNSNHLLNYSAIDHFPYMGVSYYRLRQTDFDGQSKLSNIVSVYFGEDNDGNFTVYTDQNQQLIISFPFNSSGKYNIRLFDMKGALVKQYNVTIADDGLLFNAGVQNVETGIYQLIINGQENSFKSRIFIGKH
jgi:hypothetical protein